MRVDGIAQEDSVSIALGPAQKCKNPKCRGERGQWAGDKATETHTRGKLRRAECGGRCRNPSLTSQTLIMNLECHTCSLGLERVCLLKEMLTSPAQANKDKSIVKIRHLQATLPHTVPEGLGKKGAGSISLASVQGRGCIIRLLGCVLSLH